MISSTLNSKGAFSFAQSFVQLSTIAARPQFELRFNAAQNAALDRLNEKIEEINKQEFGRGKSALLRIKTTRLEREKAEIGPFQSTVKTNQSSVKDAIAQAWMLFAQPEADEDMVVSAKARSFAERKATIQTGGGITTNEMLLGRPTR